MCPKAEAGQNEPKGKGSHMKINFEYFQIQKWMLQTVRGEKIDEKRSHLSSFHVPFLSYGP